MKKVTRKQLESYRSVNAEIAELKHKLAHLGEGDSLIANDVIMDYRSGYPVPQSVVGYDFDRERILRMRYMQQIEKLEKESVEIEDFIENISDSLTRRIFRMYFIDGIPQKKVAKQVHMSQAAVSKKIFQFLKME